MNSHLDMLAVLRSAESAQAIPGIPALTEHLHNRVLKVGVTAFQEFAYLQKVAAEIWGPERTSHFALVLRMTRVAPKVEKVSRWKMPGAVISQLPVDWQSSLQAVAERSKAGRISPGFTIWSADYLGAVATALRRYVDYARSHGANLIPAGSDLHHYAMWLTNPTNSEYGVSVRAAADYLIRIKAGVAIIDPFTVSPGRDFVVRYWREKAEAGGTPTKTGDQLVGAVAIYDLGFQLIEQARAEPMRGIKAATIYRNGLILVLGIALPQRARAISALIFNSTLWVQQLDRLHVRIPARMLKMREDRKAGDPFDVIWHNARLATALEEYRRFFRPLFDDGSCLFPSIHAPGQSISEKRIGQLSAAITEEMLGVRIPIHRFRDNAATDAAENLFGGRFATAALLGHADIGSGDPYDHSDGVKAAAEFGSFLDSRRTAPVGLVL